MKFYKNIETNVVEPLEEIKEGYVEVVANTTDAALEKHVPVYEINEDEILVKVGSVEHPMTEEHYIVWIAQVNGEEFNKVDLKPFDKPEATFKYKKGSEIYAYCNLHGLWKTIVK